MTPFLNALLRSVFARLLAGPGARILGAAAGSDRPTMAEAVFLVCAGVLLTIVAFVVAYAGIQSVGWSLEHPSQLIVAILGIGALFGGVLAAGLALRWLRLRGISLLVGCGALPILMLGALVVGWWAIPMLFVAAAIDSARRSVRGGAPARPDVGIAPDEPRP